MADHEDRETDIVRWPARPSTFSSIGRLGKEAARRAIRVSQIRVLTVTDSAKRVENMLSAADEITAGRGSNFVNTLRF
jgi:hypothetical protein